MSGPNLGRVEALYHEMRALPADDRKQALGAVREQNPALADEVQALLDQPESLFSGASSGLAGKRLGPFEIQGLLGVGGMGEVYRAHDPKLGRDVAIKVLPSAVASDPDRMTRFRREARVLAALNHPSIAAIHGIEEAEGRTALILELADGDDLSQRLRRGPIPVDEAINLARQIAEGLEAAHEKGIVHRDIKPANIKVAPDGRVKILDFGLAKAYLPESRPASQEELSSSPTDTRATHSGAILGTAGYMAPEQVRGGLADNRADIWSFGVVLYEMLTGAWLFRGDTPGDTMAAVLKTDPDWAKLPGETPGRVRLLLDRCLRRDIKSRLQHIGEARIALSDPNSWSPAEGVSWKVGPSERLWKAVPWVASAGLGAALLVMASKPGLVPPADRKHLQVSIGAKASLHTGWGPAAILSPDGGTLAFVADEAGVRRLFVRRLDELRATALPGTEDANHPFFSPDGGWVAFFAEGKLKKVAATGGPVITLCDAARGRGGAWGEDDSVVFAPDPGAPLQRVSALGGASVLLGTDGSEPGTRRWPQMLPGGKGILYTWDTAARLDGFEDGELLVAPMQSGTAKVVVSNAYFGRYAPTGHLIFARKGRLFAVPFDVESLETVGDAVPIMDSVDMNPGSGGAQISFSWNGILAYLPKREVQVPVDWVTREGVVSSLSAPAADWANPRFSPDGRKLAFDASDGRQRDIFVFDLERGVRTQLTFDSANDFLPIWSPDGRLLVFSSDRALGGVANLYWMNADGTNEATSLAASPEDQLAGSWHPSGKWLAISSDTPDRKLDVRILPIAHDPARGLIAGPSVDFLATPQIEGRPMFSPDGRWLAYSSDETGEVEVFVRSFPASGGKWRVSRRGGWFPRWSARDARLMFTELNGRGVMFAHYDSQGDSFRTTEPAPWTKVAHEALGGFLPYDAHPDGRRIVMRVDRNEGINQIILYTGFFERLRAIGQANEGGRP